MYRRVHRSAAATAVSVVVLGCAASAAPIVAQSVASYEPLVARQSPFELSIRNIMRGSEHIGEAPVGVTWSDDGEWVYFRWLPGGPPPISWFFVLTLPAVDP